VSRLLVEEVPGCEKAGPGSELVDRDLEIPVGATALGVIELSRTWSSEVELGDGSRARG